MDDFSILEMQEMQKALQEKYKDKWEPIGPETGKNKLLWMIGEIGEVADIVKKNGGTKASSDPSLRPGYGGSACAARGGGSLRKAGQGQAAQVSPTGAQIQLGGGADGTDRTGPERSGRHRKSLPYRQK